MAGRYEKKQKKRKPLWLAAVLLLAVAACGFFLKKDNPEAIEFQVQEETLFRITDADRLQQLKELLSLSFPKEA